MEKQKSKVVSFGRVAAVAALCLLAWLQTVPAQSQDVDPRITPGGVESGLRPVEEKGGVKLPEFVVQEEGRDLKGAEGVEFDLKWIRFRGNKVISSEELIWLVDEYLDKKVAVSDLQKIADQVTTYYREQGYILTRAYVPPQNIELQDGGGKITIVIHEGRLGRVIINGNQRYERDMIRKVMKVLSKEGVISAASIERTLLLLMDYPGLKVRATFVPSVEPGTTNVVVDVTEDKMFAIGADFNNFGNEYVAENQLGVNVSLNNLTGVGDALYFRSVFGPDAIGDFHDGGLFYNRLEYMRPLGYHGTRLGLAYSYLVYNMGEGLEVLEADGASHQANIFVTHPFIRSRNLSWWADAGFDYKRSQLELFEGGAYKLQDDSLFNLHLGTHLEYVDRLMGRNVINFQLVQGLMQSSINSRLHDAEEQFTKAEVRLNRFQQLPWRFSALVSANGQLSVNRLPSIEQLSIGGATTVRGYSQSEFSADSGFYSTFELRWTVWDKWGEWFTSDKERSSLQLAGFVDYGKVWGADPYIGELDDAEIAGAGAGLRFAWSPWVQAKIDWAKYIAGRKPLDEDVEDNGIWYLQLSVPY